MYHKMTICAALLAASVLVTGRSHAQEFEVRSPIRRNLPSDFGREAERERLQKELRSLRKEQSRLASVDRWIDGESRELTKEMEGIYADFEYVSQKKKAGKDTIEESWRLDSRSRNYSVRKDRLDQYRTKQRADKVEFNKRITDLASDVTALERGSRSYDSMPRRPLPVRPH